MTFTKTIILGAALALTAPAFAQVSTKIGGGDDRGVDSTTSGAGMTGRSEAPIAGSGNQGATSGEVGSRASSAAKGNDPTGVNGATNNRF